MLLVAMVEVGVHLILTITIADQTVVQVTLAHLAVAQEVAVVPTSTRAHLITVIWAQVAAADAYYRAQAATVATGQATFACQAEKAVTVAQRAT